MSTHQSRRPAGTPAGGQFATGARAETGLTLPGPATAARSAAQVTADARHALDQAISNRDEDWTPTLEQIAPDVRDDIREEMFRDAYVAELMVRAGGDEHYEADRDRALNRLGQWQEREARWRSDPAFSCPTAEVTEQGTGGPVVYTTAVGGKYTGWRDVASIAKDVRADLKAAQKVGFLPEDVTFQVVTSKYSGGQSLDVVVRGVPDADHFVNDPVGWDDRQRPCQAAIEIQDRVGAIAKAYDRSTIDSQSDYYQVGYWCNVRIETEQAAELRARAAAERKAKRK